MKKKNDGIQWAIHNGNSVIGKGDLVGIIKISSDELAVFARSQTDVGIVTGQQGKYVPIEDGSPDGIKAEYTQSGLGKKAASKAVKDYGVICAYLIEKGYIG